MGPPGSQPNGFKMFIRGKDEVTEQGHCGHFPWSFKRYLGENGEARRADLKPLYGDALFGTIKIDVLRCIPDGKTRIFVDPVIPTKSKEKSKKTGQKSDEQPSLIRKLAMAARAERAGGPSMEDAMVAMGDLPEFPFAESAKRSREQAPQDPSSLASYKPNISPWKGTPYDYNLPSNAPRYIDSIGRPYATFIFKYREQGSSHTGSVRAKILTSLVSRRGKGVGCLDRQGGRGGVQAC